MSDDKLLGVRFVVRQSGVWDALRALEVLKVGDVEVFPVAPMLALPAPEGKRKSGPKAHGVVQPKVRAAMALKQKRRVPEIAREIGEKKQSVNSAIMVMIQQGVVKKVGTGLYMRTKPDPIPTNGAAA